MRHSVFYWEKIASRFFVDLYGDWEEKEIPDDLKDQASEYREKLIEKVVEEDDSIMEKYLEGNEPKEEELIRKFYSNEIKETDDDKVSEMQDQNNQNNQNPNS